MTDDEVEFCGVAEGNGALGIETRRLFLVPFQFLTILNKNLHF